MLTRAVEKIATVADKDLPVFSGDASALQEANGQLAQKIEEQSAVLLQNSGILPLQKGTSLAVIGALASETRIQGAGSSHITTPESISILDGLTNAGHEYDYSPGYNLNGIFSDVLLKEAQEVATKAETVVVVLGLPATAEAEGSDRTNIDLPANQTTLLNAVNAVNQNIIVLLVAGSVVDTSWSPKTKAILNIFLGGQRVGAATERLLFGAVSPSGKLAESYPVNYADVPSSQLFGVNTRSVAYAESLYVGYRYYEKAKVSVAYPFGFGLSYSKFEISNLSASASALASNETNISVTVTVKNTGTVRAAEVLQTYVGQDNQNQLIPLKTLAGFTKIWLDPNESQTITFKIPRHAFERWDEEQHKFTLAGGNWTIFVGTSSQDILKTFALNVDAPEFLIAAPTWYQQPNGLPTVTGFTDFTTMDVFPDLPEQPGDFTRLSVPRDMGDHSKIVKKIASVIIKNMQKNDKVTPDSPEGKFLETIVLDTPIIRLSQQSGGSLKLWMVDFLVGLANHGKRG